MECLIAKWPNDQGPAGRLVEPRLEDSPPAAEQQGAGQRYDEKASAIQKRPEFPVLLENSGLICTS